MVIRKIMNSYYITLLNDCQIGDLLSHRVNSVEHSILCYNAHGFKPSEIDYLALL
jgi:hypothetical protein